MELIALFDGIVGSVMEIQQLNGGGIVVPTVFYYGLIGVLIWAGLFALQGVALHTMATRRNLKKPWRAFVPFVNLLLMGELAGKCHFFGKRIKRAGLWLMIAQIVATILMLLHTLAQVYLYTVCGAPQVSPQTGLQYWTGLSGFSLVAFRVCNICSYIAPIAQLFYEVLLFIVMVSLYKNYSHKNHMLFGVLCFLIPISRMIVLFVLRKNKYVDYDAYMRARREAYMRQQQQYNPYGNPSPYGAPRQNPYEDSARSNQPQTPPEDPFEEFSSQPGDKKTDGKDDVFEDILN